MKIKLCMTSIKYQENKNTKTSRKYCKKTNIAKQIKTTFTKVKKYKF